MKESNFTVIPWRKHELIVASCFVLFGVALFFFTAGYLYG